MLAPTTSASHSSGYNEGRDRAWKVWNVRLTSKFHAVNQGPGRARAEGEEMSAAETSAYLLMAGGLIWVFVGIVGLVWRRGDGLRTGQDQAEGGEKTDFIGND